jgi:hypothetical protein
MIDVYHPESTRPRLMIDLFSIRNSQATSPLTSSSSSSNPKIHGNTIHSPSPGQLTANIAQKSKAKEKK